MEHQETSTNTDQRETGLAGAEGSASDLLRQWKDMNEARNESIRERENNWGAPPIGIEEAMHFTRSDVSALMWFVDKTLKLLAAQEAGKPNVASETRRALPEQHDKR